LASTRDWRGVINTDEKIYRNSSMSSTYPAFLILQNSLHTDFLSLHLINPVSATCAAAFAMVPLIQKYRI